MSNTPQDTAGGLSSEEAAQRLRQFGPNLIETQREATWWRAVWSQLRSPITLLLIFSSGLSLVVHEATEVTMILVIIVASIALGMWQERGASRILEKLPGNGADSFVRVARRTSDRSAGFRIGGWRCAGTVRGCEDLGGLPVIGSRRFVHQ